jgi:site-specific recombinase XerD
MIPTDLAVHLTAFLGSYLPAQRGASHNTVMAYRDAFTLLLRYCRDKKGRPPEKLMLADIDAPCVLAFLDHLGNERRCLPQTRNQRLAAIHAFFRYVQTEEPDKLAHCQRILAIRTHRVAQKPVTYLCPDDMAGILAEPDQATVKGRRDAALLSMLYDTGARVQELADVRVSDLRLDSPQHVRLTGKGRKTRIVPLLPATTSLLVAYVEEQHIDGAERRDGPLFFNQRREQLTRHGIRYILRKYAAKAGKQWAGLPAAISPHTLRHAKAMHLLQAGNPAVVIRDILGHSDIKTTAIYARADIEAKRRALEKAAPGVSSTATPSWKKDPGLMDWLRGLH